MPRRRRAFIERSRATTYQLVHAPTSDNPEHLVFVPSTDRPGSASAAGASSDAPIAPANDASAPDADELQSSYKAADYELGEFGFPDDGYDYAKHFRTIGGGGGVYMDAVTGLPNPDAVRSRSAALRQNSDTPAPKRDGGIILREDVQTDTDAQSKAPASVGSAAGSEEPTQPQEEPESPWRDPHDELQRMAAIEEIYRDRKHNTDLATVMAALDSGSEQDEDGTLSSLLAHATLQGPEQLTGACEVGKGETLPKEKDDEVEEDGELHESDGDGEYDDDDFELADDFVQQADCPDSDHNDADDAKRGGTSILEGVIEGYREPRALDEEFERFMQGYELDVSSDEEIAMYRSDMCKMAKDEDADIGAGDIHALLTADELAAMDGGEVAVEDGDLADGLAGLSLFNDKPGINGGGDPDDGDDGPNDGEAGTTPFVAAEFDDGMARLLQSYERVDADTAFAAHDGLAGARAALQRQMAADAARAARKADKRAGEGDDGSGSEADSELDAHFDELYNDDDADSKWDCETILTTYSNLDNHPSVIDDAPPRRRRAPRDAAPAPVIRLDPRTQAAEESVEEAEAQGADDGAVDYGSRRPVAPGGGIARDRAESKADKKARKVAVKEAARERRALKSEMKKAFGAEHVKQGRHAASIGKSKVAMQF